MCNSASTHTTNNAACVVTTVTAYDTVWFPIEYAPIYNSNFVQVGHLSEGYITCYEIEKWNDLYQYLISNRSDKDEK